MRSLMTWSLLSISPLCCSACRNSPLLAQQALRSQCFPTGALHSDVRTSVKRALSLSTPRPNLSYRIGASFSAKGRRFNPKEDTFSFNPSVDHNAFTGRPNSGQDAFFVSTTGSINGNGGRKKVAFGVADGVGGWADAGIDSADFSHGLCSTMSSIAQDLFKRNTDNLPNKLLQISYDKLVKDGNVTGGGSTVCVGVGDEDGSFSVAK